MMEGAHSRRKANPTALAIVVLMHGAALTALALAKGEVIRDAITRTKVFDVPEVKPPPEEPPKPDEKAVTPPDTAITHVTPLVPPPPLERLVELAPLPPVPVPALPEVPQVLPPRADPPAPPAEARKVAPARARANLASYVSDEDYPSSAVRNEEQGTTRFRLAVGPDGRVGDCIVTASSGSSALDSATCRLMKQRARFIPARDSSDRPTSDSVTSAIRWVLPE